MTATSQKQQDIRFLELSIKHEHAMADLYETFYNLVPCCQGLWKDLRNEERQHAHRLEVLLNEVKSGNAVLDPEHHQYIVIEASLKALEEKNTLWQNVGVEIKEAFEYALLLEGGVIEDRFFAPMENDSELTQQILWEMRSGTNDHFQRLREEYEKHSYSAGFVKHLAATVKTLLNPLDRSHLK